MKVLPEDLPEFYWKLRDLWVRLFFIFLVLFALSWSFKSGYKDIQEIDPRVFSAPKQISLGSRANPVRLQTSDGMWKLVPLYHYEISGLVTSKVDYRLPNLFHTIIEKDELKSIWPLDISLIYGENVRNGLYKKSKIHSDVSYQGRIAYLSFPMSEMSKYHRTDFSNNHLVSINPKIKKLLYGVTVGDQIQMKGKLVNIFEEKNGQLFGPMKTSTVRNDNGCEIILVEEVHFLKKAHPFWRNVFLVSQNALVVLGVCFVLLLFLSSRL